VTIRKGEAWGSVGRPPEGLPVAADGPDLFRILNGEPCPQAVGLLAGDLARTLGAGHEHGRWVAGGDLVVVPLDIGVATHDAGIHRFASHAVARRWWWRGPILGAFNAQFLGGWDVAPRAHPNDGFLDIVEVDGAMGLRQRWAARSRLPTASHLPHPHIRTRRARHVEWNFPEPLDLWLDGVEVGRTRTLAIAVESEPLTLYV